MCRATWRIRLHLSHHGLPRELRRWPPLHMSRIEGMLSDTALKGMENGPLSQHGRAHRQFDHYRAAPTANARAGGGATRVYDERDINSRALVAALIQCIAPTGWRGVSSPLGEHRDRIARNPRDAIPRVRSIRDIHRNKLITPKSTSKRH